MTAEDKMLKRTRTADMGRGLPSRHGEVTPTRTTPEDGDIVVREELRAETPVYVLHIAPGADQYEFGEREEGSAHALALGEHHQVRAWLTDEGYDFVLLEDFRRGNRSDFTLNQCGR
jgi:hypothetical protein